jgi:predicted MFS family arabinose efflux permease
MLHARGAAIQPVQTHRPGGAGNLVRFAAALALFGFAQSVVNAVFNNFLSETFSISNLARGMLELPREMPGFLVVFVSALFFFLSSRRLAALANLLAAAGIILVGFYSTGFPPMLLWLFIFSTGLHLFLPLISGIGMEFARERETGRILGKFNGVMNLTAILGSFAVFLGFRYFGFTFGIAFAVAAAGFLLAAVFLFSMEPDRPLPALGRFTLRREYRLYYWLSILFGTRKQLFITFAPWVLVTVFRQPTETVATLLTVGGVIGIGFNPLLGRAIDRLGERAILTGEALLLVFVCLGYGFSRSILPERAAFMVAASCFIMDQLLMSVGMARATYLQKIALKPEDISQTLAMGVTIDHVFSIAIALASGLVWNRFGYQYVFLMGAAIALVNLVSASFLKTPAKGSAGGRGANAL